MPLYWRLNTDIGVLNAKNVLWNGPLVQMEKIKFCEIIIKQNDQNMPRHRGLGEERTTSYFSYVLSEGRKIESRRQLKKTGHCIKIKTQSWKNWNWKRNKRTPVNDHIDAWAGARNGLDLKLVRQKEKETRFEGCGLRKREKHERQER